MFSTRNKNYNAHYYSRSSNVKKPVRAIEHATKKNQNYYPHITKNFHIFFIEMPLKNLGLFCNRVRYGYDIPTLLLEGSNTPRCHKKHHRDRPAGDSWCSVFGC